MDPSAIIGVLSSGIGAAIGWGLARRSNETDQLRNLYADWATAAYDFMKLLQRLLGDMDVDALVNQVPISFLIDSVHEDTLAYSKTGIPKARYRLEGAKFKAGIADPVPALAAEVDVLTKRFLELSLSTKYEVITAEIEALEKFCRTRLRNRFRLRDWFSILSDDRSVTEAAPPQLPPAP